MPPENRFFNDFSRVASGALNALSGLKTETEALVRQQVEHFLAGINLVSREEFDAVQAMAAKARESQEKIEARLAEIEAELAALKAAPARRKAAPPPAPEEGQG